MRHLQLFLKIEALMNLIRYKVMNEEEGLLRIEESIKEYRNHEKEKK